MEPLQNIKLTFKCPKQLNELQPCNGYRYCDGCQKVVHDFRGMAEEQVLDAFAKSNYRMCGIFKADRIQVAPQQNRWLRWVSAAMLALGMTTLHQRLYAQVPHGADTVTKNKDISYKLGELQVLPRQKFSKEAIKRSQKDTTDNIVFGGMGYEPEFPGGQAALAKYLYDHVKYSGDRDGKAYVQFVVETDGSLTNIKMIRSAGKDIDEQIVKALKSGKKWKPGIENGKPTRVQYTVPFNLVCKE